MSSITDAKPSRSLTGLIRLSPQYKLQEENQMFDIRYSRKLTGQLLKATLFIAVSTGFVAVSIHYPGPSASLKPLQPNVVASSSLPANLSSPAETQAGEAYGKLPLSFEVNKGQTDAQVKFLSRAGGFVLLLTKKEAGSGPAHPRPVLVREARTRSAAWQKPGTD